MNSDTVNPMPASPAIPTTWRRPTPGGSSPRPSRVLRRMAPATPTSLPTTSPAVTPSVIREVAASPSRPPVSRTPALASANSGTMT
jgi:hypothetical protein